MVWVHWARIWNLLWPLPGEEGSKSSSRCLAETWIPKRLRRKEAEPSERHCYALEERTLGAGAMRTCVCICLLRPARRHRGRPGSHTLIGDCESDLGWAAQTHWQSPVVPLPWGTRFTAGRAGTELRKCSVADESGPQRQRTRGVVSHTHRGRCAATGSTTTAP